MNDLPIGEIIAANTSGFTAQTIEIPRPDAVATLPDPPAFGAFVRVGQTSSVGAAVTDADDDPFDTTSKPADLGDESPTLYGIVCFAEVGSLEPGRPLSAFGLSEEELLRQQPQIYELMAARFTVVLVAHAGKDGQMRPYLPPRPPRPHARVYVADDEETRRLTAHLSYLRGLLEGGNVMGVSYPPDELVAALLRRAWQAHGGDAKFLHGAGKELAVLLAQEYDRLRAILARVVG